MLSHANNSDLLRLAQLACAALVIGKKAQCWGLEKSCRFSSRVSKEEVGRLIVVIPLVASVSEEKVS